MQLAVFVVVVYSFALFFLWNLYESLNAYNEIPLNNNALDFSSKLKNSFIFLKHRNLLSLARDRVSLREWECIDTCEIHDVMREPLRAKRAKFLNLHWSWFFPPASSRRHSNVKKKLLKKITFWLSSNWNFIFCLFLLIEWVESGVLRQPQTATKKNWAWKFLRFSFPPRRHLLIIFKLILGVAERKKNYLSTAHILSSRRGKKKIVCDFFSISIFEIHSDFPNATA